MENQKESTLIEDQKQSSGESDISNPVGSGWRPSSKSNKEKNSDLKQKSSDTNIRQNKDQSANPSKKTENSDNQSDSSMGIIKKIIIAVIAFIIVAKFGVIGFILIAIVIVIRGFNKLRQSKIFGVIVGEARGVKERTEQTSDQKTIIIRTFHIERYDDDGNRITPVPVEMRGKSHKGLIREGDQIEVRGKWGEGQIMRVSKVYNKTTQSHVKSKKAASSPVHIKIGDFLGWTLWYIIMGAIFVGLFYLIKSMI